MTLTIPPLGVGTWAWGDKSTWGMGGYDAAFTEATIREAWEASIDAGVLLFDTAEIYGAGESERIIGRLLKADPSVRDRIVIASKFMPVPWKVSVKSQLAAAARASTERMGIEKIDLYQLHAPISIRSHNALAEALAIAHQQGLIDAVGVSNYSAKEMNAFAAALKKHDLTLASNQIEYSLLRTMPDRVGLLQACQDLHVTPLAYSPIGQGRLTGKYSAANPPKGKRTFADHPMSEVDAIVAILRRIGAAHGDRTPSQVALAYLMAKGTVPIPGAKNKQQAEENAGALGWRMTAEELTELDGAALFGQRTLSQRFFQHG
jgi:aryl-alcohol dehydrogenase-like predicted oxidoreductase